MAFLKDIAGRDGKWSSRKVWYNLSCLSVTGCMIYITYRGMDDNGYIAMLSIYLITVGCFDVLLKVIDMILQFKGSRTTTTITATKESETTNG